MMMTPSSANINFQCRCPDMKRVGHVKNLNKKGEMTSPHGDAILSLAQESHMTDLCNGNVLEEGIPSEGLHRWPVGNPCEKRTDRNRRSKQWNHFRQEPQEILPSKMTTNASKDILHKDVFLFWAKKADDSNNKAAPRVSDSKKAIEEQQKMLDSHPRSSKEGVGCTKGRCWPPSSTRPGTTLRKTWRDLFPDPEVFRQIDNHVLHVSKQVEYDVDGFLGLSEKIHTPEQVLQTGRGVCSGYAHLYCEMCKHDDFFFLTDPESFIQSHWPDDPEWQLIQPPISLEFFEDRVYKTPEFFKLQLSLQSPDTSMLQTDQGEAMVSLASSHSTEFTYQLLKFCHDDSKEDIGKSHGMLTMSEKKMALKVFPPTEGLFDLQIFARPSGSRKPYTWVCSYQIKCLESNGKELLPKNPFSFWGLHPKTREFGIEGCNWDEALALATRGRLTLVLKTHRPLLATYEFVHQDLDETLSRKCLVSQSEEEKLSCHILCPFLGYYRLSVFVKGLSEDEFKNTANFLIHCSGCINQNELFPSGLGTHCGAGISSRSRGLSNPSHTSPIINTQKGQCNITFHTQPSFEVTATLGKDNMMNNIYPMERYMLITHLENKVSVSILLPESGIYRVGLYGRSREGEEFTHVCDYIIRCFTDPQWLPFPKVYSSWRRGCVLLQPRTGVLQEKSWVRFRVKMPKAYSAHVIGHSKMDLKLGQNKVWEGDVYTGLAGTTLKVAVKFSHESQSMDVILSFDVEGNTSGSGDSSG
ncbi:hypothetical protein JD844_026119 [Phrynosoma platyrhinos]|uniref:Kyphoscoliosis peptidase n=1 Tax=Phrynosoma platyrhinos TaxID=52577 RepID=A0ABQ7SEH0_PHRPL|nr:hypothetical protein JD844_026119 [Phrynosoma platyrhinos]